MRIFTRRLIFRASTLFFILLALGSTAAGATDSSANSANFIGPAQQWDWDIACADCPRTFTTASGNLKLDGAGNPHVMYGQDHVYHQWYDGDQWQLETADGSPGVGAYASLAIDADGWLHSSYSARYDNGLKYAHQTAQGWQIETVERGSQVGERTHLALDSQNRPHIIYLDSRNHILKYAHLMDAGWDIQVLDDIGSYSVAPEIVIDQADRPHIAVNDRDPNEEIKYGFWDGAAWQFEVVTTLDFVQNPIRYGSRLPEVADLIDLHQLIFRHQGFRLIFEY